MRHVEGDQAWGISVFKVEEHRPCADGNCVWEGHPCVHYSGYVSVATSNFVSVNDGRFVCQLFVDSAYDESFRCDNFVQTISVLHKGTTAKRLVTVNYVPSTAFMNRFTLIGAAAHCSVPPLHT